MSKNIDISTVCPECNKETVLTVNYDAYSKWIAGELIQRAFPDMHYSQREMFISGMCPVCWDKLFKEDKE